MDFQSDLFPESLPKLVSVEHKKEDTNADKFHRFHEANPAVYWAIVNMAKMMKRRGLTRWSTRDAFATLRYMSIMIDTGNDYKLCNTHSPFYSRMIMDRVPELDGFFKTKPAEADG